MGRFGSSRLRIVWASVCLLLAGLAFGAIQGFGANGSGLVVFGTTIPLGFEQAKPYVVDNLARLVYTMVPAVILFGGFVPLLEWMGSGARAERMKGLFLGVALCFLHGLFLSQLAMLPVLAASHRLLGTPFDGKLMVADLNGLILGLQLLLWSALLAWVLKSNRGLAVFFAYVLHEVGRVMAWGGEWLGDLEVPRLVVNGMAFLGHLLPTARIPAEPMPWGVLPIALGGPAAILALLLLLPAKGAKRSRG